MRQFIAAVVVPPSCAPTEAKIGLDSTRSVLIIQRLACGAWGGKVLKIPRLNCCAGSTPAPGTIIFQ